MLAQGIPAVVQITRFEGCGSVVIGANFHHNVMVCSLTPASQATDLQLGVAAVVGLAALVCSRVASSTCTAHQQLDVWCARTSAVHGAADGHPERK